MKVNLGCGRNPLDGYVNIDRLPLPGVDIVADLDEPITIHPDDQGQVTEIIGIDLIEHIRNPLPLMEALWLWASPDCVCTFALPYGSSDDAWEDPTHVRPYFLNSWMYFAQPTYYRADYGYRGDWQVSRITLDVTCGGTLEEVQAQVMTLRNVVARQVVELRAVKPARPPDRDLWENPQIAFKRV